MIIYYNNPVKFVLNTIVNVHVEACVNMIYIGKIVFRFIIHKLLEKAMMEGNTVPEREKQPLLPKKQHPQARPQAPQLYRQQVGEQNNFLHGKSIPIL